ncbi:HK97 gp10 family phage protein [Clostridium oryzae]|uniref:HK97 gp10 family phage protein n=1 Tax=Clostridium oryzae TaxID=1450648 RepID=A0A1V4IER1_9CLOT|nr:HK97 gp10 family phage protein [Clostridium oryzae]OPJ58443.1 hypothetical protein CLORY_35930 [Clostridium oryzae]
MPTGSSQSGSEQIIEELQKMCSDMHSEVEKKLSELGERVEALAIENTPARAQKVIKGYRVSEPKHIGNDKVFVRVSNSSADFNALEAGYKTMNEKGHVNGYVPGKHMLENAYTKVNNNVMAEFDELIKRVIK